MDTTLIISISLGVMTFIFINIFLEVKFFSGIRTFLLDTLDTIADNIGNYNTKRYVARMKKEKIVYQKETAIAKYNRLVESLILDLNLPLTLESFNSILGIIFAILTLCAVIVMKNITLSVVITVAIFVAILTLLAMQSKSVKIQRLEDIMDAEDLICPLARDGVLVAIKKVMESDEYINASIRPFFQQFIDNCENNGYSFKQAITLLNKQLGSKFDNFTKKAIVFEYNERKGMADIFLDIVDENAVLREINARKDRIFRKMNRDFFIKTIVILLFFIYALSIPDFSAFMMKTDAGKFINTSMISIICLSFAKCLALQGDLGIGGK